MYELSLRRFLPLRAFMYDARHAYRLLESFVPFYWEVIVG